MKVKKVILSILLIASFILIGTPLNYNTTILNLIIIVLGALYGIYKIFYKKEKIINEKIDLIVFVFYMMPIVPLIFGNSDSVSETLIALARNMSLFNMYSFIKELVGKDKKTSDLIMTIFIFCTSGLVLLGIDEEISKVVYKHFLSLGIPESFEFKNRFVSTIGYPNTFAVITSIGIFLSIYKLRNSKILYSGMIFLFIFGLILSYSRAVLAIFAVILLIYLALNKRKRKYFIYNIDQNTILALICVKIYESAYASKQYTFLLIGIAICFSLSVLISKLIAKKYIKICRIKKKNYIILSAILVVVLLLAIIIGLKLEKPLELYKDNAINQDVSYNIKNIEGNKEYCFTFEIDASLKNNSKSQIYSIEVIELNKYEDSISSKEIVFGEYKGTKEIKLKTSKESKGIRIVISSKSKVSQNGLTINSLKINDEKYVLDYLYLPVNLVERLKSFSFSEKSVWERLTFYKDGLNIAKDDLFIGKGARAWLYNYGNFQSYVYTTTETHSYPVELLIEYGIFSVILLGCIVCYALLKMFKRRKLTEIDMAFILLVLHSIMDFDLSYFVMLVVFISLFVLSIKQGNEHQKEIKNITLNKIIHPILIGANILILILGINGYILEKKEDKLIQEIISYINNRNSSKALEKVLEIEEKQKYKDVIYDALLIINYNNVNEDDLKEIYEMLKEQEIVANTKLNMKRNNIIKNIIEDTSNNKTRDKLKEIIVKENDEMVANIKNQDVNRLNKKQIESYLKQQERIYSLVKYK